MSDDSTLVQQLSSYEAMGMDPAAATAALFAPASIEAAAVSGSDGTASTQLSPSSVKPNDLSVALVVVYAATSISAAEMASIIHTYYPDLSALGVGEAVLAGLPETTEAEMYNALIGCGFSATESQGAVNVLYPATVTIKSNKSWQATGVDVTGQQITKLVYVSGSWTANPATGMVGPSGNSKYKAKSGYTLAGANEGAMIGKVGNNAPFLVGTSCTAPSGQSGMLSLCINDDLNNKYGCGLSDNQGTLTFTITTSNPS